MLELKHLYKNFLRSNGEDTIRVLDNLTFNIEDGEFVIIIGSNGCGKTTLMNCIAGEKNIDKGSIILNGTDISKLKEFQRAKYCGRVFQDPTMGTVKDMSILENLELAFRRGKLHSPLRWGFKKENKEEAIKLLSAFDLGLEARLESKVGLLSGGQRQALTLIMASLNNPDILMLDEHTAALDPKTARKVLTLTNKIVTEKKLTTLMITHNMKDAITYGSRLIMLHKGKIYKEFKGEEKKNLTVEQLTTLFDKLNDLESK